MKILGHQPQLGAGFGEHAAVGSFALLVRKQSRDAVRPQHQLDTALRPRELLLLQCLQLDGQAIALAVFWLRVELDQVDFHIIGRLLDIDFFLVELLVVGAEQAHSQGRGPGRRGSRFFARRGRRRFRQADRLGANRQRDLGPGSGDRDAGRQQLQGGFDRFAAVVAHVNKEVLRRIRPEEQVNLHRVGVVHLVAEEDFHWLARGLRQRERRGQPTDHQSQNRQHDGFFVGAAPGQGNGKLSRLHGDSP